MVSPLIPILAFGAFTFFRKKTPSKSRAIVVIQGATADSIMLDLGERLSVQFLEGPGEDWKMTNAPDGFLLGSAKLKWAPGPGDKKLKTFNFESKRSGTTKAEFTKYVDGLPGADFRQIKILIED